MKSAVLFLIESAVAMTILLMFYRYLYFKMAYFEWSRFYLIFAVLISIIIPLLPVPEILKPAEKNWHFILNETRIQLPVIEESSKYKLFTDTVLISISGIWLIGFTSHAFTFAGNLKKINRLKKNSKAIPWGSFTRYKSSKPDMISFSFFKNIFTGKTFDKLPADAQKNILEHEKHHARRLHSADRIFFELCRLIFWFNPFTKTLLSSLKEVHEFSADKQVTGNRFNENYSRLLVKLASKSLMYPTTAAFAENKQLKHRLQLIADPEPDKIRKRRFAASLPVLLLAIFGLWFVAMNIKAITVTSENGKLHPPILAKDYTAKIPFFEKQKISAIFKESQSVANPDEILNHPQIDYKTKSGAEIFAAGKGVIRQIDTTDFQGLHEISVHIKTQNNEEYIYEKLAELCATENKLVKKGQIIGFTGDSALYPIFTFKMKKNGIFTNPEKHFSE